MKANYPAARVTRHAGLKKHSVYMKPSYPESMKRMFYHLKGFFPFFFTFLSLGFRTNFRDFLFSMQNSCAFNKISSRGAEYSGEKYLHWTIVISPSRDPGSFCRDLREASCPPVPLNSEPAKQYFNIAAGISSLPNNSTSRVTRLHINRP